MTRDDIIRMAREAGMQAVVAETADAVERFAQLVAAAEREACAKVCEKYADVLDPLRPEGVAADYFQGGVKSASRRNASAIRARGQQ